MLDSKPLWFFKVFPVWWLQILLGIFTNWYYWILWRGNWLIFKCLYNAFWYVKPTKSTIILGVSAHLNNPNVSFGVEIKYVQLNLETSVKYKIWFVFRLPWSVPTFLIHAESGLRADCGVRKYAMSSLHRAILKEISNYQSPHYAIAMATLYLQYKQVSPT